MQAKDLIVLGSSRLLGKLYCGDVDIGGSASFTGDLSVSGKTTTNRLVVTNTTDISGTSSPSNAPLVVGSLTGQHIEFDGNEIIAKNSSATSTLNLNTDGGIVNLSGGSIKADGSTFTATTISNTNLTSTNITSNSITNNENIINNGDIVNKNGIIETDTIVSTNWDIVSTQNMGGDFFVAPTIMVTEGSTFYISSITNGVIAGYIVDSTNITSDAFAGHSWTSGSKIKITGTITQGTNSYILGTCDGTLTANMNSSSGRITFSITCNAATLPTATGSYTISDGTIMMYSVGGSNRVGIYMTSYGIDHSEYNASNANKRNKYSYIDIFNGADGTNPKVRIGKLDGLPAINSISPTGYGIYTTNGYFKGLIVANGGKIAGWTIGDEYITTNAERTTYNSESKTGMTMTSNGIGAYASSSAKFTLSTAGVLTATGADITGTIKATSGFIGQNATNGFTISNSAIYNPSTKSSLSSDTVDGIYLGKDGIALGKGKFKVTNAGYLTATSGSISGSIIASGINADNITTGKLQAARIAVGDYNNYITSNENDANSIIHGTLSDDGWIYKNNTSNNIWLSPALPNWTKGGEQYRITGVVKLPEPGYVTIRVYGRLADTTASSQSTKTFYNLNEANTEYNIDGIITIADSVANEALTNICISFYNSSGNNTTGYCKQMRFERMTGGSLIVDGSITANKIEANSITLGKINTDDQSLILNSNIEISGRNLLLDTKDNTVNQQTTKSFVATSALDNVTATDTLTLSFWAKGEIAMWCDFYFYEGNTIRNQTSYYYPSFQLTTNWQYFRYSGLATSVAATATGLRFRTNNVEHGATSTSPGISYIKEVKLEKGNKATEWSPAPEEVETDIDSASKTATTYITDIDSNKGITIKPSNSTGNDYLQMNSTAIEFYRNSTTNSVMSLSDDTFRIGLDASGHSTVKSDGLHIWTGTESTAANEVAVFGSTITIGQTGSGKFNTYIDANGLYIRKATTNLASYGSDIKFYDGNGTAASNIAAQIGSTGISIKKGDITLGSNFSVSSTGVLNATSATVSGALTASSLTIDSGASISGDGASQILNSEIEIGGRNLYISSTAVDGYLHSNGTSVSAMTSAKEQTSDFISVDGISTLTLQCWTPDLTSSDQTWLAYAFYSAKNMSNVIGSRIAKYSTAGVKYLSYVDIPVVSGAKYIRVSYRKKENGYIKVETGNKATDWTPAPEDIDVNKYVTEIDSNGIWITPSGNKPSNTGTGAGATGTKIDANGIGIYNSGTKLAEYGSNTSFYSSNGTLTAKIESNATYGSLMVINHLVVSSSSNPSVNDMWIGPGGISTTRSYEDGSTWAESIMGINGGEIHMDSHKSDATGLIGAISIKPGRILATSYENSPVEANIRAASAAGSIYMYSQPTSSGNRGIYAIDGSSTYKAVIDITSNNLCYFRGAADSVSDLKKKDVIADYDWKIDDFINGLKPIAYRFKHDDGSLGDRIRMGFGAQDVRDLTKSLYDEELSLYRARIIDETKEGTEREQPYHGEDIDDEKLLWSLTYEELIAPMVLEIQRLMARVDKLEVELKKYQNGSKYL